MPLVGVSPRLKLLLGRAFFRPKSALVNIINSQIAIVYIRHVVAGDDLC
jgi:hypothetical protein